MPFSGAGVYTPPAADFPVVTQTVISSTHFNNTINDIATALSTCLTKDGQQTATANIPFGGFRATNVGITAIAGSVGTPAINVSDVGTGLYRSAASELAVTVAGTQRARFDGTGLIVTGVGTFSGATSTTTLTASTSVVTPLVSNSGADLLIDTISGNTNIRLQPRGGGNVIPNDDNVHTFGASTNRWSAVFAPIIDTGTTGSGALKTNNGTTVLTWANSLLVTLAGNLTVSGGTVGTGATSDLLVTTSGGTQAQFVHTVSSTRWVTIAGSNGGLPTLAVTAGGRLAITPTIAVGTGPATVGFLSVPYSSGTPSLTSRNNGNSADMTLITSDTRNAVVDLVMVGLTSTNGVQLKVRSGAGAPTTSDLAASEWTVWRDTSGVTTKVYYNNAGAIIASAAFS